jgi:hypothetical protein
LAAYGLGGGNGERQDPVFQPDNHMTAGAAALVSLPERLDDRGSLIVIEGGEEIQFDIKRVFFFYDVPGDATRGGHAHRCLQEFILAVSGSFSIIVDNGKKRARHVLDQPSLGLYVGPMNWIELQDFSVGSVCLVLASSHYNEADYYRDYDEFIHDKLNVS